MRAILTYHSLDRSGSPISLDPDVFRAQVRWLAAGRVAVVPLDRLAAQPADVEAVALTFDDGFANFEDTAAPLLRDAGLPATVFVVTGHVGGDNRWGGRAAPSVPTLPLLDWPALARLAEQGITLGAHTVTHPPLPTLPDGALEAELTAASERLHQETGARPAALAYPYGALDGRVAAAAARHYRLGCTTELRPLGRTEDPLRLPRLDMYYFRRAGDLEAWGSGRFRRRLWIRRQARRLRSALTPTVGAAA